jgi:hypothetical protein
LEWQDVAVLLVVPADPLHPRRPDEYFAPEVDAAGDLGVDVALIDHDAAGQGDAEGALRPVRTSSNDAVYRGWMLRSEHHAALVSALHPFPSDFGTWSPRRQEVERRLLGNLGRYQELRSQGCRLPADHHLDRFS